MLSKIKSSTNDCGARYNSNFGDGLNGFLPIKSFDGLIGFKLPKTL